LIDEERNQESQLQESIFFFKEGYLEEVW